MDKNHNWVSGRVLHCVFDALVRKNLIIYEKDSWYAINKSQGHEY